MAVPYTFGSATSSIPLSQLDSNFATGITLGNTTVYLGNTTTSFGNVTLTNVTISSVSAAITPSQGGTGLVTIPANNVMLGNGTANVTVVAPGTTGNVLTSNGTTWASTALSASSVPAAGSTTQVQYNNAGAFAGSANLTFNGTTLTAAGLSGPHNGTVGATTANTGAFTTLSASSTVSGTGFSTYLASPPAIGGTAPAAGAFTTLTATTAIGTSSGGTGLTSFTSGGVVYASSTSALATGSALTFDGTNLGVGGTSGGAKLHVITSNPSISTVESSNGTGGYQTFSNGSTVPLYVGFGGTLVTGLSTSDAAFRYSNNLVFGYGATEVMRLTSTSLYTASGINLIVGGSSVIDSSKVQFYGAKTISDGIPQQQLNIADTSAIATGVGGAISFSALFSGSSYTTMGSIEGVRENGTSGNYAGALVLKTRANGGNNNEVARITSTGNLGLGVTPSASSSLVKAFDVNTTGGFGSYSNSTSTQFTYVSSNAYLNSSANFTYKFTGVAAYAYLQGNNTGHVWYSAASGTAGNAISFTQAATLTADGNYVVGDTISEFRIAAVVQGGANRNIFQAGISGYSNGLTVKWNHATSTTRVNITSIPTSSAGLSTGDLWNDGGTLKIA